ncbi:MAG TPA: hypothetical protein VFD59_17495 [Nocardioidaceae bacterium]|nr:hypothetical protein [Nocardioidaceae bacterium]
MLRNLKPLAVIAALVCPAALMVSPSAAGESPARAWAPAASAKIHPGVQMYTKGAQCTANFVFKDGRGRTYVGYAAHCAGLGEATDTNGCKAKSLPLGTPVRFASDGTVVDAGTTVGHGRLAYSSWRTMRRIGTKASNPCEYNDFALVRVNAADAGKVNPTVPFFGGPEGLNTRGTTAGEQVYSYGSSSLRPPVLHEKFGGSLGTTGGGWSHNVYTATPGIPGDSGSGFLDSNGNAFGTLSTVAIAPLAGSNGVGDLSRELAFAKQHSGIGGLRLVKGIKAFNPSPAG